MRKLYATLLLCILLTSCVQHPCTSVEAQLDTITECKDFVIVDRDGCGPATQEYINDWVMTLDCGACYTEPAGDVWTVTMGEAQP